jgi:chloramphenicol O-acetyltransferase type A
VSFQVLKQYSRRQHLEFYRSHPSPFYGCTFELDATRVHARAHDIGASTYAAMCWAFHRALLQVEAFRVRLDAEDVVLYDSLTVGLVVPAPGDAYSFAAIEWNPVAAHFLRDAAGAMARASGRVDLKAGAAPDFAYYTALPEVPFTHLSHVALADPAAGQPNVAFGAFARCHGTLTVPVGIAVNHLYVHGVDLGALFKAAKASFSQAF